MLTQQAFLIPQLKVKYGSVWYLMHFDFCAETTYSGEQYERMYSNVIVLHEQMYSTSEMSTVTKNGMTEIH